MNFRVLAEEELRNYAAKRETLERLQKQSAFLGQVAQNFYGQMVLLPDRREIEERIERMRREVSMVERADQVYTELVRICGDLKRQIPSCAGGDR